MFIPALFIIVKTGISPDVQQEVKQTLVVQTMEYYLTMKRNELWIHATTWVNIQEIVLSEKNQSKKVTYCLTAYTKHF